MSTGRQIKTTVMRKMTILLLLLIPINVFAPENRCLYVERGESINPYERIWQAVCLTESNNDPLAYNPEEESYGVSQIRQIRLTHFKAISGINYTLTDMYSPEKSKVVFMYFAVRIGAKNTDKIIQDWNGSGAMTLEYLKNVKSKLATL